MIERNALTYLLNWKKKSKKKPLIIRGARQIGKTTLVHQFAKTYQHYLYFNLDLPADKVLFDKQTDFNALVQTLFLSKGISLDATNTLLFIDEIQESPNAIKQLRYFYESDLLVDVIAAGSLLEHVLGDLKSFPVGRISYLALHPMNFKEYLRASNNPKLIDSLEQVPCPDYAIPLLMKHFHQFALIGGMPEVVAAYSDTKDVHYLNDIFETLLSSYKDDVTKYAKNRTEATIIRHIIDIAPKEADNRIQFEGFGNSNFGSREVGNAMRSLQAAKLLQLIYPSSALQPPIQPNLRKRPRLQFIDTGLMNYALGLQVELIGVEDLSPIYKGKIIQHLVTQELISTFDKPSQQPYFWAREKKTSNAEIDLIYQYGKYLIPIEIKAGKTGRLRSLHIFMDQADHPYAIRLYNGPLQIDQIQTLNGKPFQLLNLPYCMGCLLPQYVEWLVEK